MKTMLQLSHVLVDEIIINADSLAGSMNEHEAGQLVAVLFEKHGVKIFNCVAEDVIAEFAEVVEEE